MSQLTALHTLHAPHLILGIEDRNTETLPPSSTPSRLLPLVSSPTAAHWRSGSAATPTMRGATHSPPVSITSGALLLDGKTDGVLGETVSYTR